MGLKVYRSSTKTKKDTRIKSSRISANKFQQKFFAKYKNLSHDERTVELEKEYWRFVEDNVGEKVKVEYAADLSSQEFGSGFPQF